MGQMFVLNLSANDTVSKMGHVLYRKWNKFVYKLKGRGPGVLINPGVVPFLPMSADPSQQGSVVADIVTNSLRFPFLVAPTFFFFFKAQLQKRGFLEPIIF